MLNIVRIVRTDYMVLRVVMPLMRACVLGSCAGRDQTESTISRLGGRMCQHVTDVLVLSAAEQPPFYF